MLGEFTTWLLQVVGQFFTDLWSFFVDACINVFDLVTQAFIAVVAAIPSPAFLTAGFGGLYTQLDPGIVYLLTKSGLPAGLALIGAGFAFRMARKVATLFQW